jgi:hypothetical protein
LKNYYTITFPGLSLSKNREKFEMHSLETKQSTGKLLPPSDLQKVGEKGGFYRKYHTAQFTDTVN